MSMPNKQFLPTDLPKRQRGEAVIKACLATALVANDKTQHIDAVLRSRFADDEAVWTLVRSPTATATTEGSVLAHTATADFFDTLSGPAARLWQYGMRLNFDRDAALMVPSITASASASAWVSQGAPIPASASCAARHSGSRSP
jgi:hypothetical protein